MLSEVRQTRKDKYCEIALYEVFKIVKFTQIEEQWLPGAGEGSWGNYYSVGTELQLGKMKFWR